MIYYRFGANLPERIYVDETKRNEKNINTKHNIILCRAFFLCVKQPFRGQPRTNQQRKKKRHNARRILWRTKQSSYSAMINVRWNNCLIRTIFFFLLYIRWWYYSSAIWPSEYRNVCMFQEHTRVAYQCHSRIWMVTDELICKAHLLCFFFFFVEFISAYCHLAWTAHCGAARIWMMMEKWSSTMNDHKTLPSVIQNKVQKCTSNCANQFPFAYHRHRSRRRRHSHHITQQQQSMCAMCICAHHMRCRRSSSSISRIGRLAMGEKKRWRAQCIRFGR